MWMWNHSEWNKNKISILKMKRTKKWNETSFENKNKNRNEMISIELLFIEWIKMIVVCDAHWKFHCVYHETEMFSKRMKRNKEEMNRHSTHT